MAFDIYRAEFPNAPKTFSNVDYQAAFFRKYSGLPSGSLSDHMAAFFRRESGLGPGLGYGTYLKAFLAKAGAPSFKEWQSGKYSDAVRTNYATSPVPQNSGTYSWANGTGQTSSGSLITGATDGPMPEVTSYQRRAITVPKTGGTDGFFSYNSARYSPVPVGTVGVPAVYLRSSVNTSVFVTATWRDLSNNNAGTVRLTDQINIEAGQWTRVAGPSVVSAENAASLGWWAYLPNAAVLPAGGVMDVTAYSAESVDAVNPYFDGSFLSTFHKRHAWVGAPYASASTQTIRTWVK